MVCSQRFPRKVYVPTLPDPVLFCLNHMQADVPDVHLCLKPRWEIRSRSNRKKKCGAGAYWSEVVPKAGR